MIQVRWFRDSDGAWRVVGLIENGWDRPVSKLLTAVEAVDANGEEIGHEDISAYPLNLSPGQQDRTWRGSSGTSQA